MATPPRPVYKGQCLFITWRAVNRCFRFVPTKTNTAIIWYALAYAASECRVQLHDIVVLSNHGHLVATFPEGNSPDFMNLFNSLTARSLNAVLGINGSVIEKGYSVIVPEDANQILDKCAYTLANPCKANLVVRGSQWKGVTSMGMNYEQPIVVHKPKRGIWKSPKADSGSSRPTKLSKRRRRDARRLDKRGRSKLPPTVELKLTRPPGLAEMSDEDIRTEVMERVSMREAAAESERVRTGKKVLGMKVVRQQFWGSMPGKEDMFGRKRTSSASSRWDLVEANHRRQDFIREYRVARRRWIEGDTEVVFPHGTWLLRRRFNVRCRTEGSFGPPLG